jgi:pyridoxal 5'-phosphate synthase pdxT subunit
MTRIGVLALQGAFREHVVMLRRLGVEASEVRLPEQLEDIDGLVIPGGESTTIGKMMEAYGLIEPLRFFVASRPVLGTCAGMIMLARRTTGGEQPLLSVMDIVVRRNAFGRQVHSFEGPLEIHLNGPDGSEPFLGVFIRAPWVETVGPGVEVLARYEGKVVGVRQGHVMAVAFHPELTGDLRIHRFFLEMVENNSEAKPLVASFGV